MRTTQFGHTIAHVHTSAGKVRFLQRKNGNYTVKTAAGRLDIFPVDGGWAYGARPGRPEVAKPFRTAKAAYVAAVKVGRV